MQIDNAIQKYIRSRSSQLADNSIRNYKHNLESFAKWIGKIELQDIRDEHIDEFQLYLKQTVSDKTRENYANTLRAFFKYWFAKREANLAWELIHAPRVAEKFPAFITHEQFERIDECLRDDEYLQLQRKLVFHMLWNTGMRISELLSLNISDIQSTNRHTFITTRKSKKLRMVMWNDQCHALLIKYLGVRICLNTAPELFQTPYHRQNCGGRTRLTARTVQRWCIQLRNELGFPIHPHAFRHGKCHQIINAGGNRHQVQSIAGHSSITSSEVYVRLNIQEQSALLEKFLPRERIEREVAMPQEVPKQNIHNVYAVAN